MVNSARRAESGRRPETVRRPSRGDSVEELHERRRRQPHLPKYTVQVRQRVPAGDAISPFRHVFGMALSFVGLPSPVCAVIDFRLGCNLLSSQIAAFLPIQYVRQESSFVMRFADYPPTSCSGWVRLELCVYGRSQVLEFIICDTPDIVLGRPAITSFEWNFNLARHAFSTDDGTVITNGAYSRFE